MLRTPNLFRLPLPPLLPILLTLLLFAIGVALLVWGADFAIDNAQRLGYRSGISTVTLGVVVVAFGTSLPELLVTSVAGVKNHPEIALGNVIGSNIANVGLIVGLTGLIAPFATKRRLLRVELPIVLGSTLLLYVCVLDLYLGRLNAFILLVCFGLYLFYVLHAERRSLLAKAQAIEKSSKSSLNRHAISSWLLLFKSMVGLAALLFGSWLIVENGAALARRMGVGEALIGLSLVAVGTSLPELAAGMAAARRRDADLIMGNILGSNIFNILLILGVAVMIRPFKVEYVVAHVDTVIAGLFSLALLPLMIFGRIRRPAGGIFLAAYIGYILWRFGLIG